MTETQTTLESLIAQSGMTLESLLDALMGAGVEVNKFADPVEDEKFGLTRSEVEDVAREDIGLLWVDESDAHRALGCQSGTATGVRCEAPLGGERIVVEWMPEHLRATHEAAGNYGRWPHNGAERLRCCPECAADLLESDPDWTEEH